MKKAQSIIEYVIFIGIITAALAVMQVYGKRGLQAAYKRTADTMGSQGETSLSFNGTQVQWFMEKDPTLRGGNKMRGVSQNSISQGKYSKTDTSMTSTAFGGTSISSIEVDTARDNPLGSKNPDCATPANWTE